jgi:hypothetical protein
MYLLSKPISPKSDEVLRNIFTHFDDMFNICYDAATLEVVGQNYAILVDQFSKVRMDIIKVEERTPFFAAWELVMKKYVAKCMSKSGTEHLRCGKGVAFYVSALLAHDANDDQVSLESI